MNPGRLELRFRFDPPKCDEAKLGLFVQEDFDAETRIAKTKTQTKTETKQNKRAQKSKLSG